MRDDESSLKNSTKWIKIKKKTKKQEVQVRIEMVRVGETMYRRGNNMMNYIMLVISKILYYTLKVEEAIQFLGTSIYHDKLPYPWTYNSKALLLC